MDPKSRSPSNQREYLQFSGPVLPSLPVQERANPLIKVIPRLEAPCELIYDRVELVPGQVYVHQRHPERRDHQVALLSGYSMVERHPPRAVDIVHLELDAGVEAYELPPDGVPGGLQGLPARQALFPVPEEPAAARAVHGARIRFVAADDAVVGRFLALAEVLDGATR